MIPRRKSLYWWRNLTHDERLLAMSDHRDLIAGYPERSTESLTGREIESLWIREMQHLSEERTADQHTYNLNKTQQ